MKKRIWTRLFAGFYQIPFDIALRDLRREFKPEVDPHDLPICDLKRVTQLCFIIFDENDGVYSFWIILVGLDGI